MNNLLSIKNLSKTYHSKNGETKALMDINLDIKEGEFICIVGSSGCGKSTLLSILAGLEDKTDGCILWNKDNPVIGYMLQSDALFPWLNIFDNAILGLKVQKKVTKDNILKVKKLLKDYSLDEFTNKFPNELSGGMKQRVVCIQ